jgi:ParB-like chromosome segregation protein Spo0J
VTTQAIKGSVIAEGLAPLATPIDNLQPDPENARRGDVAAIRRSLNAFGQRKPVVVKKTGTDASGRPTGIVIAGNHTYAAAVELGWTEIAAIFTDDDAMTARAYALADNRTGELASWDDDRLAEHLKSLNADGQVDMSTLGWTDAELARIVGDAAGALTDFREYDESIDGGPVAGKLVTCPGCGEQFEP